MTGSTPKFEAFWNLYPRKVAKKAAMQAWDKSGYEEIGDQVIEGLKRQLKYMTEPKFIPHPRTETRIDVRPPAPVEKKEHLPPPQMDGWKGNLNRVLVELVYRAGGVPDDVLERLIRGRDHYAKQFREMWGETAPREEFTEVMLNVVENFRKVIEGKA